MNPAAWQQLIDFYTAGLEKIAAERRSLDLRRDDIDGRISALDAKLGESQSAVGRVVENVTVHASVGRAGRLTLTLSYAVLNASWRPTYDARLSSSDKTLSLGYFGVVRQNTGEDWKAVALTLSTARPSVGGATPSLQPWILAQREQAPRGRDGLNLSPFVVEADKDTGYAATSTLAGTRIQSNLKDVGGSISAVTGKFLRDSDSANSQDLLVATGYPEVGGQALYQQAAMDNRATSATFRIPGLTDVPSDNVPHKVGVTTVTLKADLAYQSVPKLLPAAFLGAAAKNDSGYPLLAGRMSSFLDGTFVANGGLTTTMPGEKLNLPFGVDDGIKVERKLVNRFTEDIGLVTSQVRVTYDAVITVTNNKSSTASVTVKDQVPISRHEKIKVEQLEPDPNESKPDDQGILSWALILKPGEKRELPLKFTITYPREFPVLGLE
jgi:hypothetical protein